MFKRKMLLIPIFVFLFTCLVGCNNTDKPIDNPKDKVGTATSYGLVNKTYVGAATVKVKNDKIEDVTYDEAFLPNTWAALNYTHEEGKELPDEVLHHLKNDQSSYYAKYISIDGQVFTGEVRTSDLVLDNVTYTTQVIKYSSDKVPDLHIYLAVLYSFHAFVKTGGMDAIFGSEICLRVRPL